MSFFSPLFTKGENYSAAAYLGGRYFGKLGENKSAPQLLSNENPGNLILVSGLILFSLSIGQKQDAFKEITSIRSNFVPFFVSDDARDGSTVLLHATQTAGYILKSIT